MEEPEKIMKEGLEAFFKARECFKKAILAYKNRGDEAKGDTYNAINVASAIKFMANAYNDLSEIWENDINV